MSWVYTLSVILHVVATLIMFGAAVQAKVKEREMVDMYTKAIENVKAISKAANEAYIKNQFGGGEDEQYVN